MSEKGRILVVEDNDFVRMQIVRFLADDGYDVVETADGAQALQHMEEKVDLALVDVRMEPMGGFEFIRSIRSHDKNTPVILVTGDQNPDLLSEAGKWGVGAVLMKPVQKDRLLMTVSRTIESSQRAKA